MKYNAHFDYDAYLSQTKEIFHTIRRGDGTFTKFIYPIVIHLRERKEFPPHLKQWIAVKRSFYRSDKYIPKHVFDALEGLIPALGYDWKATKETKDYSVLFQEINEENFTPELYLEKAKIVFTKSQNKTVFSQFLKPIVLHLSAGEKLPYALKQWLNSKRSLYLQKKSLSKEIYVGLETLTPLLGYDWKKRQNVVVLPFEQWIEELTAVLDANPSKPLSDRHRRWLYKQRALFHEQSSVKPFPKEKQEALDALIPKLGFDWKVYKTKYN